jgi:hypothetical protein
VTGPRFAVVNPTFVRPIALQTVNLPSALEDEDDDEYEDEDEVVSRPWFRLDRALDSV